MAVPTVASSAPDDVAPLPSLASVVAEFTATFGFDWSPVTTRKHRDDFERFNDWLIETGHPTTIESLDFVVLATYVQDLRSRPSVRGFRRGSVEHGARLAAGSARTLSANSINAYLRPIRSLAIWLVDEGRLATNPFRRSRRRAARNPLLPTEDTPTKSATIADLRLLEAACAGDRPVDYRDRAMVSVLTTTAARNSSVRLLAVQDVDFEREVIVFRRGKGAKTLEVALHPATAAAIRTYLDLGRPALLATHPDPAATESTILFLSEAPSPAPRPLSMNAVSRMLTRRYRRGGGSLPYFGSHRIRHATATLLVNNGMPLEEVSRYLGHASTDVTRRYAQQTAETLGERAAAALARAGLG